MTDAKEGSRFALKVSIIELHYQGGTDKIKRVSSRYHTDSHRPAVLAISTAELKTTPSRYSATLLAGLEKVLSQSHQVACRAQSNNNPVKIRSAVLTSILANIVL